MSLGIKFSRGLSLWKYRNRIWISLLSVLKKKKKRLNLFGSLWDFFFPLKILPLPSSKLVILAFVFSSPVLGLLADSSDKMPNDQGKWVDGLSFLSSLLWPIMSFLLFLFLFVPEKQYHVLKTTCLLAKVELSPCLWHLGYLKSWGIYLGAK